MNTHADPIDTTDEREQPDESGLDLPARRKRRLVTPVTTGLAALLIAAGGFIAGVEVQKGQGSSSSGAAGAAGAAAGAPGAQRGGGAGARAQGSGAFTAGTVAHKSGRLLYVTDANGTTIKVKTTTNSKITRNASTGVGGIYPGDTVIVQGSAASSGVVTATQITATSKTAAASGGGLRGGFFRGGGPPGGGPGASGGGGSAGGAGASGGGGSAGGGASGGGGPGG